jgi:hypothetical protein
VAGSYLTNDSSHFVPEAGARAGDTLALTCCADVLTREPPADDQTISDGSESFNVLGAFGVVGSEGLHVVPDGEGREESVSLPGVQYAPSIGLDLNSADRPVSEQSVRKDATARSGEQVECV